VFYTRRDHKLFSIIIDHHTKVPMLERAATAKEIYGFEKAGLTAAIGPINNISARMTGNLDALEVSYLQNIQF
jgi:hypothetical protein